MLAWRLAAVLSIVPAVQPLPAADDLLQLIAVSVRSNAIAKRACAPIALAFILVVVCERPRCQFDDHENVVSAAQRSLRTVAIGGSACSHVPAPDCSGAALVGESVRVHMLVNRASA